MANISIGKEGDQIRLMLVSAVRIFFDGAWTCNGYSTSGKVVEVKIEGIIGIDTIIYGGALYPLSPQPDDNYYVIVERP